MSNPVIKVSNISKKYLIHHRQKERYTALRDVMARDVKNFGRKLLSPFTIHHSPFTAPEEEFYALKDVSFEIKQGDRVGIIGRNGAGKSTLLKVLSRITEPTTGRIEIKGRVASLLEVGTGFHPELTGRENIFLNGAILGMTKAEIKRKFDEIVDFAEIEKFLDTPVKRYSSGMYVRLAFAVAAHLEPEILIVDEVLAVGDAQFQKKCLGKMEEVGKEGRTILFVSHNMAAIRQLCSRGILLSNGTLAYDAESTETISYYMQATFNKKTKSFRCYRHIKGDGRAQVTKVTLNELNDEEVIIPIFENIKISIDYVINEPVHELEFFVLIHSSEGDIQASLFQKDSSMPTRPQSEKGTSHVKFTNYFMPGEYFISVGIFDKSRQFLDWVENAEAFSVDPSFSDGRHFDHRLGKITLLGNWKDEQ